MKFEDHNGMHSPLDAINAMKDLEENMTPKDYGV